MKTLSTIVIISLLSSGLLYAKKERSAEQIWQKKCAMCHNIDKPNNDLERKKMVAPPILVAMKSVVVTIDAVEGPFSPEELREESIEVLKDFMYEPTRDKVNCEDMMINKFGMMPSLKGFISQKELDKVIPWVYDTFKPTIVDGKVVPKK